MKTEFRSAIIVLAAIAVAVAVASFYFNSIPGSSVAFQPALTNDTDTVVKIDKSRFQKAPELQGISGYVNTEPITMADLKGKVVIVDFWTYSCINCIRTIPYLNAWYDKYSDDGLVILGVHTPEFDFEKNYGNLQTAVEKFGIKYPVVQDNTMSTWKVYSNHYWPHKYIVDYEGYIRYDHIGEGSYNETESVIQGLLKERVASLGMKSNIDGDIVSPENAVGVNFNRILTPELYLGYSFGGEVGNKERLVPNGITTFSLPNDLVSNKVNLQGIWKGNSDNAELISDTGKVVLSYGAKVVNIVAAGDSKLTIKLDGEVLGSASYGNDAHDGMVNVSEERLYSLVSAEDYGKHVIEIDVTGKGFRLYTFTFG